MAPESFNGHAYTPNMDRIAQEGMRFLNAQVADPACNPSHIAMLTGLRPASTGITTLGPAHKKPPPQTRRGLIFVGSKALFLVIGDAQGFGLGRAPS